MALIRHVSSSEKKEINVAYFCIILTSLIHVITFMITFFVCSISDNYKNIIFEKLDIEFKTGKNSFASRILKRAYDRNASKRPAV